MEDRRGRWRPGGSGGSGRWARTCGAALLAVALAACGSDGGPAPGSSDEAAAAREELPVTPLGEFFGWDPNADADAAQAEFEADERERQALVVDCMAAQGFDYIPVDYAAAAVFEDPHADLTPEERAAEIGYGFTLHVDQTENPAEEFVDPNQEALEAMDEATRDAWYAALYGEPGEPQIDEDGNEVYEQQGGCEQESYAQQNPEQAVFEELQDEFEELYERQEADPRLVAAEAGWASCMAGRGHDFDEPEAIFEHLQQRMDEEVYRFDEVTFDEEGTPDGPTWDEEGLAAVRAAEIELAVADLACQEEVDLEGVRLQVAIDAEEAFIAEHREVLERARPDGGS